MSSHELELAKKIFLSGLGIAAMAKEKVECVVNELVQRGDVSKKDADGIVEALVKRGQEAEGEIQVIIRQEIVKIMDEMGIATKKDIQAIEEKDEEIGMMIVVVAVRANHSYGLKNKKHHYRICSPRNA